MSTYYLVDFENVGLKGLEGLETLSKDDILHLFSTTKGTKLDSVELERFNTVQWKMHNAPVKDQSVDKHLVSYLGYLLGTKNKSDFVIIISNDSGYDDIISFWKKECDVKIQRSSSIKKMLPTKEKPKNGKTKPSPTATTKSGNTNTSGGAQRTAVNDAIQKRLSKEKLDNEVITYVASLGSKHHALENGKQTVYRSLVQRFGIQYGGDIYRIIKELL